MPARSAEPDPVIETDRLVLRRFAAHDLDAYHALLAHPEVARWLMPMETRDEALRNMAMMEGFWRLRGASMMAVTLRGSGALIGRCGPWRPDILGDEVEVGWTIAPDHQGQGYATEAAGAAIAWAAEAFGVTQVVHMIEDRNTASQAVARRLGSVRTDRVITHPLVGPIPIWTHDIKG